MSDWKFKDWYEANKKSYNKKRRQRYLTDSEYKDRIREVNRISREKRKKEDLVEKGKVSSAKRIFRTHLPFRKYKVGKDSETLITIGALASSLGVSIVSLRLWEKKGIIPETKTRTPKGDRLYSLEQIKEIKEMLKSRGKFGSQGGNVLGVIPYSVRWVDGTVSEEKFFRSKVLSKALGRSSTWLQNMILEGVIPETPFKNKGGQRIFTSEMIIEVRKVFDSIEGRISKDNKELFKESVRKSWEDLGVIDAKIIFIDGRNKN